MISRLDDSVFEKISKTIIRKIEIANANQWELDSHKIAPAIPRASDAESEATETISQIQFPTPIRGKKGDQAPILDGEKIIINETVEIHEHAGEVFRRLREIDNISCEDVIGSLNPAENSAAIKNAGES